MSTGGFGQAAWSLCAVLLGYGDNIISGRAVYPELCGALDGQSHVVVDGAELSIHYLPVSVKPTWSPCSQNSNKSKFICSLP